MKLPIQIPHNKGGKDKDLVFINKGTLSLAESPLYERLVLRRGELAEVVVNGIAFKSPLVALDETPRFLLNTSLFENFNEDITLGIKVNKKIPEAIIAETRLILQVIHDKCKTEGAVLIGYNSKDETFKAYIPKQTVSGVAVDMEPEDINAVLAEEGIDTIAASFHSHPFGKGGSFLSGTDHDNEDNIKGVPIASFNFDPTALSKGVYSFGKMEISFHGIPLQQLDLVEEVPSVLSLPDDKRAEILAKVIKKVDKAKPIVYAYGRSNFNNDKGAADRCGFNSWKKPGNQVAVIERGFNYREDEDDPFDFMDPENEGLDDMGGVCYPEDQPLKTDWCEDPGLWMEALMLWELRNYKQNTSTPDLTYNAIRVLCDRLDSDAIAICVSQIFDYVHPGKQLPIPVLTSLRKMSGNSIDLLNGILKSLYTGLLTSMEQDDSDDLPETLIAEMQNIQASFAKTTKLTPIEELEISIHLFTEDDEVVEYLMKFIIIIISRLATEGVEPVPTNEVVLEEQAVPTEEVEEVDKEYLNKVETPEASDPVIGKVPPL